MEVKPHKILHPFRKLNKQLIDAYVRDIAEGSTQKLAAFVQGVTPRIIQIWTLQGEVDLEYDNEDSLCAYLVRSLSKVVQNEVKMCRSNILMSPKGHSGAQWTLEHAHWRDFSSHASILELAAEIDQLKAGLKDVKNSNVDAQENVDKSS